MANSYDPTAPDPTAERKSSKDLPWWTENIDHKITEDVSLTRTYELRPRGAALTKFQVQKFFQTYSGIPSDELSSHVHSIVRTST
jgi:hypothetical protein